MLQATEQQKVLTMGVPQLLNDATLQAEPPGETHVQDDARLD